MFVITIIMNI